MNEHEKWMQSALAEARKAADEGEVPIGAVVVSGGKIIGRGHNMVEALNDSTAHAEMIALTAAQGGEGKYLPEASLYVTVEPCLMCAGAIGWSQIKTVVFGAYDAKKGYSSYLRPDRSAFHPKCRVVAGVLENECKKLMIDFFESRR